MAADEFGLSQLAQQALWANADVFFFRDEKAQLV